MQTVVIFASCSMRHSQNWTPDFSKILTRGVKGIREEAQTKLAALSDPRDIVYKKPFLDAAIMTCDAMTTWSKRYAQLARELAAKEADPQRKGELLEIADICERVPENPARTLREALQAQWWGQVQPHEQTSCAMGQGRMDQYLWPFYEKDIAEGGSRKSLAMELLHCLWLNMAQCIEIKMNP
jgi:formate C-acetyltransferase